jgi:hypothetical protein
MTDRHQAGDPVERRPEIVPVASLGLTGMDPIRTLTGEGVSHISASNKVWAVNAAATADEADWNAAAIPSPMDENTTPPCSATVLRTNSSCRDNAPRMADSPACQSRVDPSISVNRNVTVPVGALTATTPYANPGRRSGSPIVSSDSTPASRPARVQSRTGWSWHHDWSAWGVLSPGEHSRQ